MRPVLKKGAVSFLITNYNYSSYIEECIRSVFKLKGTHFDISIIIVDDGSTDGSKEKLEYLKSTYQFDTIYMDENKGKINALNKTIPLLSTEFAVILDSDDVLCSNFLEEMMMVIIRNPNIDFVYSDCYLIDDLGNNLGKGKSRAFDKDLVQEASYIPECAITRTNLLMEVLPLDERIKVSTKHHKWRKLVEIGAVGLHIAAPLFKYRMHQNNLSGIGNRIISEIGSGGLNEAILSGYWRTSIR